MGFINAGNERLPIYKKKKLNLIILMIMNRYMFIFIFKNTATVINK